MTNFPIVSVVIPVYNTEEYLCKCLESVATQSLREIEIICIDDGSTDRSFQVMQRFSSQDDRFILLKQKNVGPGMTRNRGLREARGKYVIFLDSDDWFEQDFLKLMVEQAENSCADVVICQADEFDTQTNKCFSGEWMLKKKYLPGLNFSPKEISDHLFQFTYGMAWDKLYRTDYILRTNITFPDLSNSEDLVFVFPSLLFAGKISVCPQVFIHHRIHRKSSVSNSREKNPDAPYQAFQMVKSILESRNLMPQFQRSFLNWAMEFLVWHVSNINDLEIQKTYFKKLKSYWFPSLGFSNHSIVFFEKKSTYLKYLLVKYLPFPAFLIVLKSYKAVARAFI